jgi:hypothetical protein
VAHSATAGFFVRDDDVGDLTDALRGFAETFAAQAIPVSYQIIPARLTPECADFLLSLRRAHPDLVEFGQHGLHHRMVVNGRELKREFGPERSFADQRAAIAEGLVLLRGALGDDIPIEVFTPPQHKFNRDTVRAAADVGHRVFSASAYATPHHQLAYALARALGLSSVRHQGISYHPGRRPEADIVEMSIGIDVDDGRAIKRSSGDLGREVDVLARNRPDVGLMFHHDLYADASSRSELAKMVGVLAERGCERFALLGALARSVSRRSR